jgi:hypothetical protein
VLYRPWHEKLYVLVLRYPVRSFALFAQIYVMKTRKVCRLECGKLLYPVEIRWLNSVDRNRLKTFDGFDGQQAVTNWKDNLLLVSELTLDSYEESSRWF